MNPMMNDLALLAIGLGLGLCFALIVAMVYGLYSANIQARRQTADAHKIIADWLQKNYAENTKLRLEVTTALSRLDAEQLRASSLAIQRAAKTLASQVDQLQKVVFAQPASPALDFSAGGLDDEAVDDARMIAEGNWLRRHPPSSSPTSGYPTIPDADPLANLTEEEKQQRVLEYFERKRAAAAGFPYSPSVFSPASTPPAAGSGIYSSLLDEASQIPKPPSLPVDFSGLDADEGAELVDKGELS